MNAKIISARKKDIIKFNNSKKINNKIFLEIINNFNAPGKSIIVYMKYNNERKIFIEFLKSFLFSKDIKSQIPQKIIFAFKNIYKDIKFSNLFNTNIGSLEGLKKLLYININESINQYNTLNKKHYSYFDIFNNIKNYFYLNSVKKSIQSLRILYFRFNNLIKTTTKIPLTFKKK